MTPTTEDAFLSPEEWTYAILVALIGVVLTYMVAPWDKEGGSADDVTEAHNPDLVEWARRRSQGME